MVEYKSICLCVTTLLLVGGCSSGHRVRPASEKKVEAAQEKIVVEAYLFDAKLKRQGKPTSFRLELFQTDSVIALGGRAYLGKGALKGRLTADSLEVYFPSSNEYLYESLSNLFVAAECSRAPSGLSLLHLFTSLPDSLEGMEDVSIAAEYTDSKRPEFLISFLDCPWRIELSYDRQEAGWRIRNFTFDNGKDITLKAKRRTYKKKVRVPSNKFRLATPGDVLRIIP